MKKYILIHPTKCGGTAVRSYLLNNYNEYFVVKGHWWKFKKNDNGIIIVRDVKDRFYSMYKYWKYGSSDCKKHSRKTIDENSTVLDFIKLIKENSKELKTRYSSIEHVLPTFNWIEGESTKNLIIIKYDKNLNNKIQNLLNYLNIPNKNIELKKLNISIIEKDNSFTKYDKEINEFIKIYYKKDFDLIYKINNNPEEFKYVL